MDADRTIYTIIDEYEENTTITLEKFVADKLQENLSDVHAWVQETYNKVTQKRPNLSRRKKGDLVRALSIREAVRFMEVSGSFSDF